MAGCIRKGIWELQGNTFFATNAVSGTGITTPDITFHYILHAQKIYSKEKTEQPDTILIFIAHAERIKEKASVTIPILFTNPVLLQIVNILAQQQEEASTDLYPAWYKPCKSQIGTGICFKKGERAHVEITATNKIPHRQDKRYREEWQKASTLDKKDTVRWVEKIRADASVTTPFSEYKRKDKQFAFSNLLPCPLDSELEIDIDELARRAIETLLNAGHPHAEDVSWQLLIGTLNTIGARLALPVAITHTSDRTRFVIAWGIGGIGCRHRYVPPLGNDVSFVFEIPQKAVI